MRGTALGITINHRQAEHPEDPKKYGAKCDVCPLKGQTPVWGDGPKDAVFAFLGEAPGRDEVSMGLPFVGRSGVTFENWLTRHGLKRREVWVDNAVLCFPPGGDMKLFLQRAKRDAKKAGKTLNDPVDCCRPRLFRALKVPQCGKCGKWVRGPDALVCTCKTPRILKTFYDMAKKGEVAPRAVMPMGNFAMRAWLGFDGITSHAGYVYNMKERREKAMLSAVRVDGRVGGDV